MAARFDIALSHRMYAGADIFLMPSEFGPCGSTSDDFYTLWHASCGSQGGRSWQILSNHTTGSRAKEPFSFAHQRNADEMADIILYAADVYETISKRGQIL